MNSKSQPAPGREPEMEQRLFSSKRAEMSTPAADKFPVRPLAALLLALAAQTCLEPPARIPAALALYLLAAGFAVWSFRRREWTLPDPPSRNPKVLLSDSTSPEVELQDSVKRPDKKIPSSSFFFFLLSSFTFLSIAFYLFGDNRFTPLNLSLWLSGIFLFLRAFWVKKNPYTDFTDKKDFSDFKKTRKSAFLRQIRAIRVPLLIFLTLLIAAFFRFYRLDSLPAEPFSDHAEKLFDVYDIAQGEARVFFPRNTGREAIQFYWTLLAAAFFRTGLSFQSLKIGTALLGFFTLPFIYLLGREIANRRAGLLAMLFAGVAYWPNVISRIGLRFPLYPLFVAPTFYFLLRGLRTNSRNDFLLSGLFLGLGLHGYTPFRIAPLLVLVTFLLHLFSRRPIRLSHYALLLFAALIVFLPLLRYSLEFPAEFWNRAASRAVVPNPAPVFVSNLWNALLMFNVNDGNIFVNSIVHRPALDVVTGALFLLGLTLLLARRRFLDLWLVAAILTLILPSAFSLAFPVENPALTRAGGALAPVFVLVGMTLDGLLSAFSVGLKRSGEALLVAGVVGILFAASAVQNYDLVFRQFAAQYDRVVWRTSEMGEVVRAFGNPDRVWIVPYEQWVDTRLPALWAGIPNRDLGLPRGKLADTLQLPAPKLFIFKASPLAANFNDTATLEELRRLYPQGELTLHESEPWWQSFWVYFVPVR
ncbi:MAG TPA: glycosyltransferase family 39 protein [Anaerolineales bacterium]|nr:glycosyltransferase family 39 protein [Anaerolineales bacterium]